MASSSRIIDYLGEGTHAARPVTPTLPTGGIGLYYETDTLATFLWNVAGAAWVQIAGPSVGSVTEVVAGLGLSGGTITTSGTIALASPVTLAHGGTDADLSATGPGIVVQGTSGAALSLVSMTNGQLLIGNTGSVPSAGTITAGTGITIGTSGGGITITNAGSAGVAEIDTGTGLTGGPVTAGQTGTVSLAAIAAGDLIANTTTASAAPSGVTLTALLDDVMGSAQGDVLFRNATTWTVLAPGTSGQVLSTGGTAGNPSWAAAGGTGTVTEVVAGTGLSGGTITSTGTVSMTNTSMTIAGHSVSLGGTQALASTDLSDTAALAYLANNQSFTKGQAVTPVVLTPGTTVALDATLGTDFTLTPVQNFTLNNPTGLKAGQTINTWITQDGTGGRVMTLGTNWQAPGGVSTITLSTAASAKDLLAGRSADGTVVSVILLKAFSH